LLAVPLFGAVEQAPIFHLRDHGRQQSGILLRLLRAEQRQH
jgi:hypothetical protein